MHPEATNNGKLKLISKLLLHECPLGHRSHGPDNRIASIDENFDNPGSDEAIRTGYQDFGWRFDGGHDVSHRRRKVEWRNNVEKDQWTDVAISYV